MPYGTLNTLFMSLCIMLVFLMQAGFLCLEAGAVRSKNAVNVAAKNLIDLILVTLIYVSIGYTIQYGWFSDLSQNAHPKGESYPYLFLLYQTLLAATAATIVSGAVSERCGLRGYTIMSIIIVTLIYPVSGQWVWGGLLGTEEGWLASIGFIDFAGSTQVHAVGGAVALAAVIIIGPRKGFHSRNHKNLRGQNQTISLLGVMLLWFGWFGFNMGSLLELNGLASRVMINTFIAGCAAGAASLAWSHLSYHKADIPLIANGVLAGLVGITAGAYAMSPTNAAITGVVAGIVCCGLMELLARLNIDDVVGAIPVHLGAGIWGTVAVGLLGDPEILNTGNDFVTQVSIQLLGSLVVSFWAFGVSYVLLKLINHWLPFRVSEESERVGLNMSEHGSTTELAEIVNDFDTQSGDGDLKPVDSDPFSELAGITQQYNRVFKHFLESQARLEFNQQAMKELEQELSKEKGHVSAADQQKNRVMDKMSREVQPSLDGIISLSEQLQDETESPEHRESLETINQSGNTLKNVIDGVMDFIQLESGKLELQPTPFQLSTLLHECQQLYLHEATTKGIELNLNIVMGTPDHLIADYKRLRQIIINLLGNACRHTDDGSITIEASTSYHTGNLIIEVTDTGEGMEQEQVDTLFGSLEQESYGGSETSLNMGMGLTICKRLTDVMGGIISVSSELNKGSKFTVQIPVNRQQKFRSYK